MMKAKINKVTIHIVQDDILKQDVMGIVHTTDPNLTVNSELAEKAGPSVQYACTQLGWCEVGSAVATDAGNLQQEKIIHVVGPRWGEGSERGKLANATWDTLRVAESNRLKSIAIPAISTGALGYPVENCAKTVLSEIIDFTFENLKYLRTIIVCLNSKLAFEAFEYEFKRQIQALKDTGEGKVRV